MVSLYEKNNPEVKRALSGEVPASAESDMPYAPACVRAVANMGIKVLTNRRRSEQLCVRNLVHSRVLVDFSVLKFDVH